MFSGIIPPMVTPLVDRDHLDVPGLERLVDHIIGGGVHGLFVLGTTGEGPSLGYDVRREIVARTCELAAGRVPVLVGVTDTSYSESLRLTEHAAECGAKGVVLAPPFYFPAGQSELQEYFEAIVGDLCLPVMLYNMPSCTKLHIEIETLRHALEHPNVVGFKDSSANMVYFHLARRVFDQHPHKSILVGPEELLAESTLLGGHGGVNGGANLFPRLYVDLYNAALNGEVERVQQLHRQVIRVTDLYRVGSHSSAVIKGIKSGLACLDICQDHMAEPLHRFRERERLQISELMEELRPLAAGATIKV
ncbi:putative 2-keto-3-deoxy-galactonate aldolase YagE [Posidoniimonas polymericola]|uniref:Putative 2-keto-3-deoxy-galactonate aldolase YagE n=1 Tax=Posidoniimonas polymericola TaxID=2528002 RepID=A0A5C5XYY6_9BACT|nr:dihydrodipicolinate synthase family protein [Posidoniimonas polymericola]TWT67761.1 putative 2-keto-3-deoxy-galactonate aldolase YagE [Posidoniimonas polymericola]